MATAAWDSDDMGQGDAEWERQFAKDEEEETEHQRKMKTDPQYRKEHEKKMRADAKLLPKTAPARKSSSPTKRSPTKRSRRRSRTVRKSGSQQEGQSWGFGSESEVETIPLGGGKRRRRKTRKSRKGRKTNARRRRR